MEKKTFFNSQVQPAITMLLECNDSLAFDMNEFSRDARDTHGLPIMLLNDYIL